MSQHLLVALCLTACTSARAPALPTPRELAQGIDERAGVALPDDAFGDSATRLVYLDQGWGPAQTIWYYHADQGSTLMPYQTFVHLEQADNVRAFMAPEHLATYRFLNQRATPNNPDALPVGLARHDDAVGLTCAACHTGQINYQGTAMRIDGAQSLVDMDRLLLDLEAALAATLADESKLARYAAAVPDGGTDEASVEAARASLSNTLAWFRDYNKANATRSPGGPGRTDAVGRIVNQCVRFTSSSANSVEPTAPTSFPVLWDAPRHDFVQWAGFAPNAGAGALGRNTGEVVGVFGRVEVVHHATEEEAKRGYDSTVNTNSIVSMEESLRGLSSPVWPEHILGAIDRELASKGETLYQTHCVSCHALLDRDDPGRKVVAQMIALDTLGTDPTNATNLVNARLPAGVLEGGVSAQGKVHGAQVTGLELIGDLVGGILSQNKEAALRSVANAKLAGIEKTEKQGDYPRPTADDPARQYLAYKARPLNGMWASAPFLHNGSIPNLYSLLLPEASRPATFTVGRLEYDPKHVGYVSDTSGPFVVDTTVIGNSNAGHRYGTELSEAERWALVEYLKTL